MEILGLANLDNMIVGIYDRDEESFLVRFKNNTTEPVQKRVVTLDTNVVDANDERYVINPLTPIVIDSDGSSHIAGEEITKSAHQYFSRVVKARPFVQNIYIGATTIVDYAGDKYVCTHSCFCSSNPTLDKAHFKIFRNYDIFFSVCELPDTTVSALVTAISGNELQDISIDTWFKLMFYASNNSYAGNLDAVKKFIDVSTHGIWYVGENNKNYDNLVLEYNYPKRFECILSSSAVNDVVDDGGKASVEVTARNSNNLIVTVDKYTLDINGEVDGLKYTRFARLDGGGQYSADEDLVIIESIETTSDDVLKNIDIDTTSLIDAIIKVTLFDKTVDQFCDLTISNIVLNRTQ